MASVITLTHCVPCSISTCLVLTCLLVYGELSPHGTILPINLGEAWWVFFIEQPELFKSPVTLCNGWYIILRMSR